MANASHLLLELLQRGGFVASIVLWRDTQSEREYEEGAKRKTKTRIVKERVRDSRTEMREYKRIENGRRRRNGDRGK